MEEKIKASVREALQNYRAENKLTQDDIASKAGISTAYVNHVENGKDHIGSTEIGDIYYKKIAQVIGFRIDPVFWKHVDTPQYLQLYSELMAAKVSGQVRALIGKTSIGKTYTVNRFVKKVPKYTYRITVSSLYRLPDIIDELCDLLNVAGTGSKVSKMKRISKSLNDLKLKGHKPHIIIDEAENMTVPVIGAFKALYDAIEKNCSLTFVATPEFLRKLELLKDKDKDGAPQFFYRIEAGIRPIKDIDKPVDFLPFLDLVECEDVREMVANLSDNYRALNNRLEYALQEADRMGTPLTEKLFRSLFNL